MTTKVMVTIIALGVVGGGAWIMLKAPTAEAPTMNEAGEEVMVSEEEIDTMSAEALQGSGPLAALMRLGQSLACDFKSENQDGTLSEGTFYYDKERVRVESQVRSDGELITSNMINDGQKMYLWGMNNGMHQGIIMTAPEDPATGIDAEADTYMTAETDQEYVDVNEAVEYDCDRWNVDSSVFVPPSDVEFMDTHAMFESMMQDMPEGMEGFDPSMFMDQ